MRTAAPRCSRYEDVPDPEPADGEVLVELRAASLNHLDVWIRKGLPSVPKPRILGADGAGVIAGTDERVVINPGIVRGGQDAHRRRDDGRHACRADRGAARLRPPDPAAISLRGGSGVPARLRDRLPDARARARACRRANGCCLGNRRRRRDRRARDREGARRAGRSSRRRATRSSRARASSAPTRPSTTRPATSSPHVKEVTGGGAHVVIDDVGEATWKRTLDAARAEGRDRRLRRDHRPEPAGRAAPRVVEAALDPRLDDGHARRLPGRLRPDRRRQGAPGRRPGLPARRGRAAHERLEAGEQLGKIVLRIP